MILVSGMVGTVDGMTDTDLRRALVLYLVGFTSYSAFLISFVGNLLVGFVSDSTTPDSAFTSPWMIVGLLVTSVYVIVISQLWYLRTKHMSNDYGKPSGYLGAYSIEVLVFFSVILPWSVFAVIVVVIDAELIRIGREMILKIIESSFWLLLIGIPVYCPAILSWNIKRLVDRRYPGMEMWVKISVSAVLGLVSALVIMYLLIYATLVVLSSVV